MSDKAIAKKSLGEEKKAVRDYKSRLKRAKSPALKKALKHALPEERTHAQLFRDAIESSRS